MCALAEQEARAAEAHRRVDLAAASGGFEIRALTELEQLKAAARVLNSVWSMPGDRSIMPFELMRALSHAGNYAVGAYQDDELVGALIAFLGMAGAHVNLHSHILGVSPRAQGHNVGHSLKQHQRAWALERGIETISWTFDPLVRRNAFFNLTKLGARATAYYESFYGQMSDSINARDESDRILATWDVDSARAHEASLGIATEPDIEALVDKGSVILLDEAQDGGPAMPPGAAPRGPVLLCKTPTDIIALRRSDHRTAERWRFAMRDALGPSMKRGYHITGVLRSGWYVLEL